MCDCKYCSDYKRKKCTLSKCCCIEERIEAHAVGYSEFMKHVFSGVRNREFQIRLNEYIKESERCPMIYRGNAHKKMFANVISDRIDIDNKMMAALYLLTADKLLWSKVRRCVCGSQINFAAVNLGSASPEAYTLFMTARDICEGTRHI